MIKTFGEDLITNSPTLAANDIFERGAGRLAHSVIVKGILIAKIFNPDVLPTVSVLSGRVQCLNKEDWKKCKRLCSYLKNTLEDHLVLRWNGKFCVPKWHIDASFAVHEDFRSHTGGILSLSDHGGAIILVCSIPGVPLRQS